MVEMIVSARSVAPANPSHGPLIEVATHNSDRAASLGVFVLSRTYEFNEGADVVAISSLWSVHGREGDVSVVREEAKYSFF